MLSQILNTCTIFIFLAVIPRFILGIPPPVSLASLQNVESDVKSIYSEAVRKCPNLEKTGLKDNEIFSNKCLNATGFNATTAVSEQNKGTVQCFMLYESLVSFCTEMNNTLSQTQGVIPTRDKLQILNDSLTGVCSGEAAIFNSSKIGTKASTLVTSLDDCLVLCMDYNGAHRVSDFCRYTYFFTTFNVSKFQEHFNKLSVSSNHLNVPPQSQPKDNPPPQPQVNSTTKPDQVQNQPVGDAVLHAIAAAQNNKPSSNVETNPVKPSEKAEVDTTQSKTAHKQEPKPDGLPPVSTQKEQTEKAMQTQQSDGQPGPASSKHVQKVVEGDAIATQQLKPNVQPDESQAQPAATKTKPDANVNSPQNTDDNAEYPDADKDQPNSDPNQDFLEEDAEGDQDDAEPKPGPALPQESSDTKSTSKKVIKPGTVEGDSVSNFNTPEEDMDGDSQFFSYFTVIMCLFIVGYVGYHNRQKVLAFILEGKKNRRPGRARRPNSANYHKLDTNLEEAISSSCTKTATNVIY